MQKITSPISAYLQWYGVTGNVINVEISAQANINGNWTFAALVEDVLQVLRNLVSI